MNFTEFTAREDDSGRRLDRVCKRIMESFNADTNVHSLLRKKLIRLNDKKAEGSVLLTEGDIISIADFLISGNKTEDPAVQETEISPVPCNLQTVFRNSHIWIINKEAGINVQPASDSSETCISEMVLAEWNASHPEKTSLSFIPSPLHRLDKKTSGLLMISQSTKGARYVSENIATHEIRKTYIGVVCGTMKEKSTWKDFTEKKAQNLKKDQFHTQKITSEAKGDQCITHAEPLNYGFYKKTPVTLVKYVIETGRKHQIRLQSSSHGFPLLGDIAYGGTSGPFFLHAAKLEFPENNPIELPLSVSAVIDSEKQGFLKRFLKIDPSELII